MGLKHKNIYVAATSQHVGKTTTTLGLTAGYQKMGFNIGYCKPLGQKFLDIRNLRVDKDCILFSDLIGFELDPTIHSPVILPTGATKEYLENPEKHNFQNEILNAEKYLQAHHDIVIYEGTGHTGVGSVVDLSNAKVAKMLNASVVMVVEGGIGSTIDMLHMTTSLFREKHVPILGVIINKVIPQKVESVRNYVGMWLEKQGIPLLGVIPYDENLAYPLVSTISRALGAEVHFYKENLDQRVEQMLAGSLVDLNALKKNKKILLITSSRTVKMALKKVREYSKHSEVVDSPLSGLLVTGEVEFGQESMNYINKHKIPVISTHLDTFGAVTKINKIEVKINQRTPWKVKRAVNMVRANVDLQKILELTEL